MRAVTGVPIKFLGTGEKLNAIEDFHPDRLANRILGMGDVLTLIEQAQSEMDMAEAERAGQRLASGEFDLDDFLRQLQQMKKMGPIGKLLEMVPGFNKLAGDIDLSSAEKDLKRIEAMIQSMTPTERHSPRLIKASRKRRIAAGSGTTVQDINVLLKQHREMQEMMKQMQKGGRSRNALSSLLGGRM
jgi:signal recognition particle subunit SRP54